MWAGRSGGMAKERLMAYSDLNDQMLGGDQHDLNGRKVSGIDGFIHPGKVKHFMFSPPQDWAIEKMKTARGVRGLRRELYRVLDIAGIRGAVCVLHPWRATSNARDEFHEAKDNGERYTNHGLWHWLIRTDRIRSEFYAYLSPHFHVIGPGYAMKSDEFHEVTEKRDRKGWIYKNIRSLETEKQVSNVLFYLLGHTAVIQDPITGGSMNSLTYFGEISYHSMGRTLEQKEHLDVECPDCTDPVYEWVGWDQEFTFDPDLKQEYWVWHWNREDHRVKPSITFDPMIYRIEKHRYWLKGQEKYYSIQIRGKEPIRDLGPPKREMIIDDHRDHAYDWVSGQWMDDNGDVVG